MNAIIGNVAEIVPGLNPKQERETPKNYEAEAALLGAILANNNALEKVSDYLKPEHFAEPAHGRIYAAILKLTDGGQIADSVQLAHFFTNDEALETVGGSSYLAELQSSVVSIINAAQYGKSIYDLHLRRAIMVLGEDSVNDACEVLVDRPASAIIEDIERELFSLSETGSSTKGRKFGAVLKSYAEIAQKAHKHDGGMVGISTGLTDLDELLGGLQKSDLLILAARPAMGKTTLATNIAFHAARNGSKVAFFSLEMSGEQLAGRMVAETSGVSSEKIRRGEVSDKDFVKVGQAFRDLEDLEYFVDDTAAIPISTLRARARRLKRQSGGLDLIVVDYLQLMTAGRRIDNKVQEVTEISGGLKAIAKELNVPVLALSQLSRQVENRDDKRPQLSDLRESGSIEQDADAVMFLYREEYYLEGREPMKKDGVGGAKHDAAVMEWEARLAACRGLAKLIVAKHRHGPTGDVTLTFKKETTKFDNYSPRSA